MLIDAWRQQGLIEKEAVVPLNPGNWTGPPTSGHTFQIPSTATYKKNKFSYIRKDIPQKLENMQFKDEYLDSFL